MIHLIVVGYIFFVKNFVGFFIGVMNQSETLSIKVHTFHMSSITDTPYLRKLFKKVLNLIKY